MKQSLPVICVGWVFLCFSTMYVKIRLNVNRTAVLINEAVPFVRVIVANYVDVC